MGNTIKEINVKDVKIKNEFYPRVGTFWQTIYIYKEAMESGSQFPPIVLAKYNNELILVDGKHRLEATILRKKDKIKAEIYEGWDEKKIFEEAILRNVSHGQSLSPYEKRRIALKLKLMKYRDEDISKLIQVPLQKLNKFVGQRLINSITGKTITETAIKSGLKHLSGQTFSEEELSNLEMNQEMLSLKSQLNLLKQLNHLIMNNLIDLDNPKIVEELLDIGKLINSIKLNL